MKHMFVSHCVVNEAFSNATPEDRKKWFKMMKESGKEHGFDLIFWGNPWGVIESLTFVCTSEKSLDKYIEWRRAWGSKRAEAGMPSYFEVSRTITITAMP